MKTIATLGMLEGENLTLRLPKHELEKLKGFKSGDLCMVEIKRQKDKRSIEQNALAWKIISQIDQKINGYLSDPWEIYLQIVQSAGIKREYEYIESHKIDELKRKYRVVQEIEKAIVLTEDGEATEIIICACMKGSSTFTKREMSSFIEALISRAYDEGIDIHHYEDALKGGK